MRYRHSILAVLFLFLGSCLSIAQDTTRTLPTGAPVVLESDTLFTLYGNLGPFSASDRAAAFVDRVTRLVESSSFDENGFVAVEDQGRYYLRYSDTTLLVVTQLDAQGRGLTVQQAANEYAQILTFATAGISGVRGIADILKIAGSLLLLFLVVWGIIWVINRGFRKLQARAETYAENNRDSVKLHRYKLISYDRQKQIIIGSVKAVKLLIIFIVLYLALPIVFWIVPMTGDLANTLIGYIVYPIKKGGAALISYIPKLIAILVVVYVMRIILRVMRSISQEIALGKVELKGFYPDWAMPTFNLLRIVIIIFTFVLIFPLLPGSGSPVFQGVSVFLGLLISLGSQSAISNIIAGLVITYMRAFNIGDRVKIGDTVGDVIERSMLVTKVRTIKNEDITIPNSTIMTSHTTNYTNAQEDRGLILHTSVTIGYDVPWRDVHQLLIKAALKTPLIKGEPMPFVLQTSLDDFYVSYQLNAYTMEPSSAARIYSDLHSNIQDIFAEADVEIMSPHYRVNREMLDTTIPTEFAPKAPPPGEKPPPGTGM